MPAQRFIVKKTQPVPIPGSEQKKLTEYSLKQNFLTQINRHLQIVGIHDYL